MSKLYYFIASSLVFLSTCGMHFFDGEEDYVVVDVDNDTTFLDYPSLLVTTQSSASNTLITTPSSILTIQSSFDVAMLFVFIFFFAFPILSVVFVFTLILCLRAYDLSHGRNIYECHHFYKSDEEGRFTFLTKF